ncbi:protein mono-ADP-ribosyltransferase PARP12 [Denticeps clupeoides]|uniref:Uncharacterized protein n=1 Tax=Denticeps clupeoides TaxID=299321 RepID=A0AAY4EHT5_9TELE|nr:protein mono-ADP-ribosyltransferase PARP12-like [Denticeps clupeoides]
MESAIIKTICQNDGSVNYDDLLQLVRSQLCFDVNATERVLENDDRFSIVTSGGEKRVIVKTQLRLCTSRNCTGCSKLHICKKFVLGDCPFDKGRRPCRYGHILHSVHNRGVLYEHDLLTLDMKELRVVLLQSDNSLLPPVCHSYNNGTGEYGKCPDGENCRRLHICERYLRGSCACFRAHDFYEPHPFKTLQDRGVPAHLMGEMKAVYTNIEALRHHDKGRQFSQSLGASACASSYPSVRTGTKPNQWQNKNQQKGPEAPQDKTEICLYFVKGSCKHGNRCWRAHCTLPYQWEVRDGRGWSALPDSETIEKDFCNPTNIYSRGIEPVCFDTMTRGLCSVRRLSTDSSVLQPTFILTTKWLWYWEDEFGNWIQYAAANGGHKMASVTSEYLEQKYLENQNAVIEFNAGTQSYEISFQDMLQKNKQYGTKKLVRRRPEFVSSADTQTIKTSKRVPTSASNFKALPAHWDKTQTPEISYKRVALQTSSSEYTEVMDLFSTTMQGFAIVSIERIQNKALWEVFQWQKEHMKKNNSGRDVRERKLFHGTDSKHIDAICLHNFDWRICGTHGTAFGKGSYFARDAKYSHSYTGDSSTRCMFVCRILVGDYASGHPSYVRPPSKDGGDTNFYDSCVDNVSSPSIFVVFEKHQVYPEYLIQYREHGHYAHYYSSQTRPATRQTPTTRSAYTPAPRPAPTQASFVQTPTPPNNPDKSCIIS